MDTFFALRCGAYEVMSMLQLTAWPGSAFILEQTPLALDFIDRRSLLVCVPPDEREALAVFQEWMPRQDDHYWGPGGPEPFESATEALRTAKLRELRIQVTRRELSRWKKARDKSTRQFIGI